MYEMRLKRAAEAAGALDKPGWIKAGHEETYSLHTGLCPGAWPLGRWPRRTGRQPERKPRSQGRGLLLN